MKRKTAELFVVYLQQAREGKAAPYRNEWREMDLEGGARAKLPSDGVLQDTRLWRGVDGRIWRCHGLSASGRPGAPCVALTQPQPFDLLAGDGVAITVGIDTARGNIVGGFNVWPLLDHGEFTRIYHLMIAALPAVWKVKKAARTAK